MEGQPITSRDRSGERAWLRVCDVAELLGVSRNTVRRWTDDGRLAAHRSPGGHRRYSRDDVFALLETLRVDAPEEGHRLWVPRASLDGDGAAQTHLASLIDTGQELAELLAHTPADVPQRLAERLCRTARAPVCEITSLDDGGGATVLASVRDGIRDDGRQGTDVPDAVRRRLAATLPAEEAVRVLRRGAELDDDERSLLDEHGCDAVIFAPVMSAGRLTGTVELCVAAGRGLEREAGLAAGFAELAAHFIETSNVVERLLRRERAARELVELGSVAAGTRNVDELLREVALHVSAAIEAACVDIYGLSGEKLLCVASAGLGIEYEHYVGDIIHLADYPATRRSLASGEPLLITGPADPVMSDHERAMFITDGFATQFTVPLYAAGQAIGVIDIFDHAAHDFADSLEFIVSVGQMIAGWIESAMLVNDLERQQKLFAELVELGSLTTREGEVASSLRSVGARLLETIDADTVEVYTLRDGRIHYEAGFAVGEEQDEWQGWNDDLANYPLTQATLDSREALVIASRDDPRLSPYEHQRFELFGYHSEICVPLIVEDRAIGYIDIFDTKPRDYAEFASFLRSAAPVIARTLENSMLLSDVRDRAAALRELVLIGELLTQPMPLDELVRLVALRLVVALESTACDIYRVEGDDLVQLVSVDAEGFQDEDVGRVLSFSTYAASKASAERGEPLVVTSPDDPRLSDFERRVFADYGVTSSISLPLMAQGRPIALIDIDDTRERDFSQHLDFVKNVGRLLAGAFEKAFLLERLEDGNRALRQILDAGLEFGSSLEIDDVLRSVALRVCSALDAPACDIYTVEGDDEQGLISVLDGVFDDTFPGQHYDLSAMRVTAHALRTREAATVYDMATDTRASDYERREWQRYGFRSGVLLPLVTRGEVIGMMVVFDRPPREFGDLDVARGLAQVAAQAIANASLYRQISDSAAHLRRLVDASLQFGASLDLGEVVGGAAEGMRAAADAACCDVYRLDGEYEVGLASADENGLDPEFPGTRYAVADLDLTRISIESLSPLAVVDVRTDPRASDFEREEWARFGLCSAVTIPLLARGEPIGFATIYDREPRDFADLTLVEGIAAAAAQAIANAQTHAQLETSAGRMALMTEASLEFSASLDLDETLLKVGTRLCALLDVPEADINVLRPDGRLCCLASIAGGELDAEWTGHHVDTDDFGSIRRAMETGQPVAVRSLEETDTSAAGLEIVKRFGEKSALVVPLVTKDGPIGTIDLIETRHLREFSAGETATAVAVAQVAALAIDNAAVYERLGDTLDRMALMAEASMEFSSSLDLDETLFKVAVRLCDLLDLPNVDVDVKRPDGELYCMACITHGERDPGWLGEPVDVSVFPALDKAMSSGNPVVVASLDDPLVTETGRELMELWGEKSHLVVPLTSKNESVGLIDLIETRRVRTFTDEEIALAVSVAQVAALAIANARLFERQSQEARRVRALLDAGRAIGSTVELDEVLARVTREACLALDVAATAVYEFDARRSRYIYRAAHEMVPSPETVEDIGTWWNIADYPGDRAIMLGDVPVVHHLSDPDLPVDRRASMEYYDERTVLNVPLRFGEERLGILRYYVYAEERRFTDDEIELARGIGEQAAIAIANARSHAQLETSAGRMALVTEASLEFSSSLDLEQTLLAVGNRLCETLDVPDCDINLLQGDQIVCLLSIVDGQNDLSWTGLAHHVEEYTAVREIVDERKVVRIASLDDPRVTEAGRESRTAYGEKSWMSVPLIVKDRVIGIVDLSETRRERVFDDEEVTTAQAICQVAAMAIDNADLFADVQARRAETEMLNTIAQKATAMLDLHEITLEVSDELRQIIPFARSHIALLEGDSLVVYRPHTGDAERLRLAAFGESADALGRRLAAEEVVRLTPQSDGDLWTMLPDSDGTLSAVAIALLTEGRLIGDLALLSAQPGAFDEVDTDLLARVGTQVSLAVKNALLYRDIKGMHLNNLKALSAALNAKDYYTLGHAARVSAYNVLLAQRLGWPDELVRQVEEAAFLHDIGKIGISDRVLLKPGKLNGEEWKAMRQHPVFSAEIIQTLFDDDLVLGVRHHHERWDGRGYPDQLDGVRIPLIARAMCIVDSYDAMSFQRPYRNALSAEECVDELHRCRGEQFDPDLTDAFIEVLADLAGRRQTAARIAAEAAARIDAEKHATLRDPADEQSEAYDEICAVLREVRDANPPTRYLTTQARLERRYVTVVDAEEKGPDHSPLGSDIFPDEVLQVLPRVLAGDDPDVNALFADQFGVWVTGLAPIRNDLGETVAVVAADLPPFEGAEEGGLRTAGEASLASVLQTAAVTSAKAEIDSISDGLTGLYNHRYLHERLDEELERALELESALSVLFCDLDRFAAFNEELGHRAGDNALRAVAHVIEQSIRAVDLASRYGGEEFVVVLLETDARGAFDVAQRIRQHVADTWIAPSQEALSMSIGVATFPEDGTTKEELLDKADWAMHVAKRQGRNRVIAFSPGEGGLPLS